MRDLRAAWSSLGPARRLRLVGLFVLVVGVAGAVGYYWIEARSAGPSIDDLMPGYSHARQRQIGIMMGTLGVTLMGWLDALQEPSTQAILAAGIATIVAFGCFRVAYLVDLHRRNGPADAPGGAPGSDDDR
jgi:hypothetical protein